MPAAPLQSNRRTRTRLRGRNRCARAASTSSTTLATALPSATSPRPSCSAVRPVGACGMHAAVDSPEGSLRWMNSARTRHVEWAAVCGRTTALRPRPAPTRATVMRKDFCALRGALLVDAVRPSLVHAKMQSLRVCSRPARLQPRLTHTLSRHQHEASSERADADRASGPWRYAGGGYVRHRRGGWGRGAVSHRIDTSSSTSQWWTVRGIGFSKLKEGPHVRGCSGQRTLGF